MPLHSPAVSPSDALAQVGDRALERASGAPASEGNAVELLLDAEQNFPAWLGAIRTADPQRMLGGRFRQSRDDRAQRVGQKQPIRTQWPSTEAVAVEANARELARARAPQRFVAPSLDHGEDLRRHLPIPQLSCQAIELLA